MSKLFLNLTDFNNRLNKQIFTNVKKGLSIEEFTKKYPTDKYDIFDKAIVESYIVSVYEQTGGEIIKGGFNDTPEVAKTLATMKEQIQNLHSVVVDDGENTVEKFVMLKAKNPKNQIKKGKIADDFNYSYGDKIEFEKTGKDIKEKVALQKIKEVEKLVQIENKLEQMQENFTELPTESVYKYGIAESIDCPYKRFNWNLTYFEDGKSQNMSVENSDGSYTNIVASQEAADFHREWNKLVEEWLSTKSEIKAIEFYENNLEDNKKYKLTAKQMLFFGF
jgi:hypothetical protein